MTSPPILEWLRLWWPVLSTLGIGALGVALVYLRREFPSRAEFTDLRQAGEDRLKVAEGTLTAHDRRIQSVEDGIKALPSKDDFHALRIDVTEIRGQVASSTKSAEATERGMRRVEEFLLNRAGG